MEWQEDGSGPYTWGEEKTYDKDKCINDIKNFLIDINNIKGKENKKNKSIELLHYLLENIWFVRNHVRFRNTVILKLKEFKTIHSEFNDLMEVCNKLLFELDEPEEDYKFEKYKDLDNIICENNKSIYENLLNFHIIVKCNNIYKTYNRNDLYEHIIKYKKFPSEEEIKYTDSEIIINIEFLFYELINTGDDTYILIPYESNMFIKKCITQKI